MAHQELNPPLPGATDARVRINDVRMRAPFASKESQNMFVETVNIQRRMIDDLMTNISIVGVVLIVILGIMVWNNAFNMKMRLLITLGCVFIMVLLMQLLQYRMRESLLRLQGIANKMVFGFTEMHRIEELANDFEMSSKSWDVRMLGERNRSLKEWSQAQARRMQHW